MKALLIVLLSTLVLQAIPLNAEIACKDIFNSSTTASAVKLVEFKDGETVFGYYSCNSCGIKVSAKPDIHDRQACPSCGTPHTTEAYSPPPMIKKNGRLYLIDPNVKIVTDEKDLNFAKSGPVWNCPFCDSSNFVVQKNCIGCGAEISNLPQTRVHEEQKELPKHVFSDKTLNRTNTLNPLRNITNGPLPLSKEFPLQTYLKLGSTIVALVGLSAVWWGYQTFDEIGEVISIDNSKVVIRYNHDSISYELILNPKAIAKNEDSFELNEQVTIYFTNFSGPVGAERNNGDAYPVLIEKH